MTTTTAQAVVIDGKKIAGDIRAELKQEALKIFEEHGVRPKLVVVQVGNREDSSTYVRMKERACLELGFDFELLKFSVDATQQEVEAKVQLLNEDYAVDGIIVQLPLPKGMDEEAVAGKIGEKKDVDGLSPENFGRLAMKDREPLFKPCTAAGCLELCRRSSITLEGKHVVVVGRSNIVGLPCSLLMQQENATVTMCHSRTMNLPQLVGMADIVVVAIGVPKFVKGDWLKQGAVVIDAGITPVPTDKGTRLRGDVDYDAACLRAGYITPVPGGVGPMTVAMLMQNVLRARQAKLKKP